MKAENKHPFRKLGRVFVTAGCWLVAVATVAGLMARYVAPDFFWMLQLVGIVLPFLAWLVLATALVSIFLKKKSLILLHSVLLLFLAIRFISIGEYPIDGAAHELSLVSYNSPYPQSRISPENEAEFQQIIAEWDPNIFGLQETFLGYLDRGGERIVGRIDVMNVLGPAGYEIARPEPKVDILFYQPVLTNFPVDTTQKIILENNPFPIESEILRTRFLWEGKPVVHYNIHLASYGASKPWHEDNSSVVSTGFWYKYLRQYRRAIQARAWEARQIRKMLDRESVPFIVSGDFNATRHNWSYNAIRGDMLDVIKAVGTGRKMTYHTRYPFARIDHILISEGFVPVAGRVLDTDRSDHRAIWGKVALVK